MFARYQKDRGYDFELLRLRSSTEYRFRSRSRAVLHMRVSKSYGILAFPNVKNVEMIYRLGACLRVICSS